MKKVLMIVPPYLQSPEKNLPSTRMRSVASLPIGALSVITYNKDIAEFYLYDQNVSGLTLSYILPVFKPDIVGISMTFDNSYPYIKKLVKEIRKVRPKIPIVIGGAATIPKQTYTTILHETTIDAVCYGDGELPMRYLLTAKDPREELRHHSCWISFWSIGKGFMPEKHLVPNLDTVIEIDYSYLNIDQYAIQEESLFVEPRENERQFYVETSRGCPFQCSFCYYSRDNDRKMRFASVEKVISYVGSLVKDHGMTVLSISDDQFMVNMKRAKEIFRQLEQFHIRVEILQGASVGFIDEEMAELMKKAGVVRVNLPIESGSQEVLDMMVEKPVDLNKAKEVIKILRKHGLWITANFVMGFPGETDTHRRETLKWVNEAGLDWCTFVAAIPIWGTKLYDMCIEKGYIDKEIRLGELDFNNYFINTPGYQREYVTREIYKMNLWCNFVNNYAMRNGDYLTASRAFRKVISMYPNHAFAHHYLAKCLCEMDQKWMEYAKDFNIWQR